MRRRAISAGSPDHGIHRNFELRTIRVVNRRLERQCGSELCPPAGRQKMSKSTTIAKMRRNGRLVRVKPDGTEEALDTPPLAPMTAAEIEAVAASDHENPPLTDARPGQLRPVPRVKTLRRALPDPHRHSAGLGTGPLRAGPASQTLTVGQSSVRFHWGCSDASHHWFTSLCAGAKTGKSANRGATSIC
jgi:hypothetical protein